MDFATAPSPGRPAAAGSPESSRRSRTSGSLYRVVWRWHFYAGVLVTPVLLAVTITGAIYIFRSEIEDHHHARLRFVDPGATRVGAQAQVDAARAACPGLPPSGLELAAEPNRASVIRLGDASGSSLSVYVDPYRGRVLGSLAPGEDDLTAFFDAVLKIHRELFLGSTGRLIVELTTGWTIVLLASGLYLWWPRHRGQAGVWGLRWRAKPYTVLRDLHTVFGFYLLAPMLVIAVTGLFYALVWGEAFHIVTRDGDRQAAVKPSVSRAGPVHGPGRPTLPLDQIEERARRQYPGRNIVISLPLRPGRGVQVAAANDYNNSYGPYVSAQFELDRFDGTLLSRKTLAEDERYWWHGWVYPLHVGSVLGPTSKVIWLITCLILAALPVTGLWMWWVRRPAGRMGFPRRPNRRLPFGLVAMIAALSILLPVVGVSIVLILIGEGIVRIGLRVRADRQPDPA